MIAADAPCWPDGTPRSRDNGFVLGHANRPHGYVIGAASANRRPPRTVGQRFPEEFKNMGRIHRGVGVAAE